jgi:hypothetical protein
MGEAILCAIILTSKKPIEEIPLSWRYGIDITKSMHHHEGEDIEIFIKNSCEGVVVSVVKRFHVLCVLLQNPVSVVNSLLICFGPLILSIFLINPAEKSHFCYSMAITVELDFPFLDYSQ